MPAPAVIPAPKAYINAAAVKGFVVELWFAKERRALLPLWRGPRDLRHREHSETRSTGVVLPSPSHGTRAGGAPVIFTVTKKARPKQSFDLNFQAWDNKPFLPDVSVKVLLVLEVCGTL